jgi:4-diphosphocytidyl-2-C-methyl-D-erythritol kinase
LPGVLINPGVPVATKDVFAALGLKPGDAFGVDQQAAPLAWPETTSPAGWLRAIAQGRNDLESSALRIQPVIGEVLAALRRSDGCELARMSGSGATCFGLFRDAANAQGAAREIRARHRDWWVEATALS